MSAPAGLVHPALEGAALAAAAQTLREGISPKQDGAIAYSASDDTLTLEVRLSGSHGHWIVAEAWHRGARSEPVRGILDIFCLAIEGLPLQEAADHGAIHALERLRGGPLARPLPGILTPRSAGTAFTCCERLIRTILAEHAAQTGEHGTANFWSPPLSAQWRAMTDAERIARLEPIIGGFRADHGLSVGDLWVDRIEKTRRVTIGFGSGLGYADKPRLLMRLEVDIRQATGDRLELFMVEAKDSNTIRRLAPGEEIR